MHARDIIMNIDSANAARQEARHAVERQLGLMDRTSKSYDGLMAALDDAIASKARELREAEAEPPAIGACIYCAGGAACTECIYAYQERLSEHRSAIRAIEEAMAELENQRSRLYEAKNALNRAMEDLRGVLEDALGELSVAFRDLTDGDGQYHNRLMYELETITGQIARLRGMMDEIDALGDWQERGVQQAGSIGSAFVNVALDAAKHFGYDDVVLRLNAGIAVDSAWVGDPVDTSTGNFHYSRTDISIPGRHPLALTRSYNSRGGAGGPFGEGWTHCHAARLEEHGGNVDVTFGDGHTERYVRIREGTFAGPAGRKNTLIPTGAEAEPYCLVGHGMESTYFGGEGQPTRTVDTRGNETHLEYDGQNRPVKIRNGCGHLLLAYDGDGRVTEAADHTGRKAVYTYRDGRLASATNPLGETWLYEYGGDGLLGKITDPEGSAEAANIYDGKGRVTVQTAADGGETTFVYDDDEKTCKVTAPGGNTVTYLRDGGYRTVGITDALGKESFSYGNDGCCTSSTDRSGSTWRHEYDIHGNMARATDPEGGTTHLEHSVLNLPTKVSGSGGGGFGICYDERGNITETRDPAGRTTKYAYDGRGNVKTVVMSDGTKRHMEHDGRGNVTSMTAAADGTPSGEEQATTYEYDALNRPVRETDPLGRETAYGYDALNRLTSITNPKGETRTFGYDHRGGLTHVKDFGGGVHGYTYDSMGRMETATDPEGGTTKYGYGVSGKPIRMTNPEGGVTEYTYDAHGRLAGAVFPDGSKVSRGHDAAGNATAVTYQDGGRTEAEYDGMGRVKSIRKPDGTAVKYEYGPDVNPLRRTDTMGNTETWEHDGAGRLTKHTDAMGGETKHAYNGGGFLESVTNPDGERTAFEYHPGGLLKSVTGPEGAHVSFGYDKAGNATSVHDTEGNRVSLAYDCLDRLTEMTDALGNTAKCEYDGSGNIISETDGNGNTERYAYSLNGLPTVTVNALGETTEYRYDGMGRLLGVEQAGVESGGKMPATESAASTESKSSTATAATAASAATTYTRDSMGRAHRLTDPEGGITEHGFDASGRVSCVTEPDGSKTIFGYDKSGRLTKVSYCDGKTVEITYNPLGHITGMRDWHGTTKIETDPLGRVTKTTDHENNVTEYRWGRTGRPEGITYPNGLEAAYSYTPSGRLGEVSVKPPTGAGVSATADTTRYSYDKSGRLTERKLPDGTTAAYGYDGAGNLAELTHAKDGAILDLIRYAYDPAGNIVRMEKERAGMERDSGVFEYAYDPLDRLVEARHTLPAGKGDADETETTITTYDYDSRGNRTKETRVRKETVNGEATQSATITRHEYDAADRLLKSATGKDVTEYRYDKRGNLVKETVNGKTKAEYVYDATNMMVSAHVEGKGTVEYMYNGFRHRIAKREKHVDAGVHVQESGDGAGSTNQNTSGCCQRTDSGSQGWTRYHLDMTRPYDNLLMETRAGSRCYVWGSGPVSAIGGLGFCKGSATGGNERYRTSSYHFLQDHLGSPIRLMGAEGSTPLAYDEFGIPRAQDEYQKTTGPYVTCRQTAAPQPPATHSPFGFTGYLHERLTDMYHAQARYYSPTTGRFLSKDPARSGRNWYVYCGNRPLTTVDPTGHMFRPASVFTGIHHIGMTVGYIRNTSGAKLEIPPGKMMLEYRDLQITINYSKLTGNKNLSREALKEIYMAFGIAGIRIPTGVMEFTRSENSRDIVQLHGIDTPFTVGQFASRDLYEDILICSRLVFYLQKTYEHFGKQITILSGFRSQYQNSRVGGVEDSQHLGGRAADIEIHGIPAYFVQKYVHYNLGFGRTHGVLVVYANSTHIDTRTDWVGTVIVSPSSPPLLPETPVPLPLPLLPIHGKDWSVVYE